MMCGLKIMHMIAFYGEKAVLSETAYIYNEDTIEFRRHDKNASSRGGGSLKYRLEGLNTEIDIISRMLLFLQKNIRNEKHISFLSEQLVVYKKKKNILETKNVIRAFLAFPYIKYYGRSRFLDNGYFLLFKEMKFDWRYFMIKKTQINEGLLLYCIIYLCSFNFLGYKVWNAF